MREFFTNEFVIRLITSFVASMAFALLFKVRYGHLAYAGSCGMISYIIYYAVGFVSPSLFAAALLSTICGACLSEIFARVRRAPTIVFLLPAVIPTVPGSDLYYAMRGFIVGDMTAAVNSLMSAIKIGLGIALGIVSVSMTFSLITDALKKRKKSNE